MPTNVADVLSRYKGKNNEYIAVKLPGDMKFTNLKETIFQDDFIVRREVKKPPLDKAIIRDRLREWPQRAKEIKYVSKATPKFRQLYKSASPAEKIHLLAQRQAAFYDQYRGRYDLYPAERQSDHQRSPAETERRGITEITDGVQSVSGCDVATDRGSEHAQNTVFFRVMHVFTWDSQNQEEVLDCDIIYQPEKEEETQGNTTSTGLPPFLASQLSKMSPDDAVTESGMEWEEDTPER